jgi:hypothetical protein
VPSTTGLGQPEVEHLDEVALGELDVRRLQVAVDDSVLVGGLDRLGDLLGNGERLGDRHGAVVEHGIERLAGHVLEDEVSPAIDLLEPVDRGNARVVERGEHLGLALETGEAIGVVGEVLRECLDRNVAVEPRVTGQVDHAHAAASDLADDVVRADSGWHCVAHGRT